VPAYADIAAVKAQLGKYAAGLTAVSVPSEDNVTNLILPNVSGIVDGVLGAHGLAVPVAAPAEFVNSLRAGVAQGAAAQVAAALFPQAAGVASTTYHVYLQKLFDDFLARLRSGEGIPHSVAPAAAGLGRSWWTSNPTDDDGRDTTEAIFKRNTEQW
jgi:hypothetical protein